MRTSTANRAHARCAQRRAPATLGLVAALTLWSSDARAESAHHTEAVTVNPIGTLVGVAATAASFPSVSLNGRYQRSLDTRWSLTVAPQFVYADVFTFENYLLGAKVGPRYALSRRYLEGWYVSPMAIAGIAFTRQLGEHAQSAFSIGVGIESGYAWHWRRFVLELGVGLNYTALVGHASEFRGEEGKTPAAGLGPVFNVSLGYGW